ncbi:DUF2254 domain-containing protein [Puniceibacterium sediminis]|uniref:Uncharacterized membrane protein n=1 Tax=Puniceibacterium sediminis TaxID=1608407 RepID=A0A238ZC44_9RHOB|nr:DUF2254 domain-containing protein [Puniceibacterium sediminis]SNR80649.1 Uncharacterized membrane protein [Puniceibacterium sediminis]
MLSKSLMLVLRFARRLGVRVVLMALLAVLAALFAPLFTGFIPDSLTERFGSEAVLPILNILAASLLTVTTFSLGVMVSAFQAASSQGTPRVYRVLMQDGTTQTVLATFVSGFLFSLTALVMFNAGFYSEAAAVVVFGLTILTILSIIVAILRWIDLLSHLGSMDHTLWQVEDAANESLQTIAGSPNLGAHRITEKVPPPPGAHPVCSKQSGYVQFIDLAGLNDALSEQDGTLWITTMPGKYVLRGQPMGHVSGTDQDLADRICEFVTLGRERTMEQDPRFGLVVLSEIAARAMSPGVNDPGTAIDVVHRLKKLLWEYSQSLSAQDAAEKPDAEEVLYPRIHLSATTAMDLVDDAYGVIIRDAAGRVEVMAQILHALCDLASVKGAMGDAARVEIAYARDHAEAAISNEADLAKVRSLAPVEQD